MGGNDKMQPPVPQSLDLGGKKFVAIVEMPTGVQIIASELMTRWEIAQYAMTALGATLGQLQQEAASRIVKPLFPGLVKG